MAREMKSEIEGGVYAFRTEIVCRSHKLKLRDPNSPV